jgi:Protein of unknown function (DUF2892)
MPNRIASNGGKMSLFMLQFRICPEMKPNIDNNGRVARGGMAVIFLLFGACLIPEAPVFAAIFVLIGLFCAFEAWIGWCAVRACGVKTPL